MAEERVQRRLAAILAADMVGYSRLMERDETGTLSRLGLLRSEVFDPETERFNGRIFKNTGDGALAEFGSAVDAVQCAVEIQRSLAQRNADLTEADRIILRIGISLGDVFVDGEDLYGNGVIVAARMEGIAEPGGICVSGNVQEHIGNTLDVALEDLGEQSVKNIERPVRCYLVRLDRKSEVGVPQTNASRTERPGIAVLPFANMSGDPEQEYFADGMVEDIITGLSRIRWLTVIARNSTFAYKGKSPDVRKVGQDLAVRYILEGSVRKASDRVRITAQLIEAETGGHLWAERFDGTLADVFDLQDQITAGVVAAIEPSVRRAEIERAKRKRPDNLDAYDLYLRALEHAYAFTSDGRGAALSLLEAAFAIDPDYTEAHGVAAWCCMQKYQWEDDAPTYREAALRHADAVASSRTEDATALALAAFAIGAYTTNYDSALAMVEQALTQNPSSSVAHTIGAVINSRLGRHDRSRSHAESALRLSPFDPMRYIPENVMANAEFVAAEYGAALDGVRRSLVANPDFTPSRIFEAACLVKLNRLEEARKSMRRVMEHTPDIRATTLRERLLTLDDDTLKAIIAPLRAAGLPE